MTADTHCSGRIIALSLLAYMLFNPPLLTLFNVAALFMGIPLFYGYMFLAWAVVIVLSMLAVRSRPPEC